MLQNSMATGRLIEIIIRIYVVRNEIRRDLEIELSVEV